MDLEDAAALSVCARVEKQRLEGQHERIWLVASGRWCLAMRRSQQERLAASMCKEGARARAGTPCVLLSAAHVASITRHRAAVLRVMQDERGQRERGKLFVRVSCAAALCASGKTGWLLRPRCCRFCSRTKFDLLSTSCSYEKSRTPVL